MKFSIIKSLVCFILSFGIITPRYVRAESLRAEDLKAKVIEKLQSDEELSEAELELGLSTASQLTKSEYAELTKLAAQLAQDHEVKVLLGKDIEELFWLIFIIIIIVISGS